MMQVSCEQSLFLLIKKIGVVELVLAAVLMQGRTAPLNPQN